MKKIKVGESKIHGRGLFVDELVKIGETIAFFKGDIIHKNNKNNKDALANPDWVGIDNQTWIDPIPPYKYVNHSCRPSAGIKGRVTIVALRNMKAGDEVTLDYSLIEGDPRWYMKCSCGEKVCRKTIRSIQSLPKNIFEKYLPYVPRYFQKVYNKESISL